MKVVYRITEKERRCGGNSKLRGEIFFTSRKKAVDYLHKKYEALSIGACLKYKKGELLRVALVPSPWYGYVTMRYELDVVPVN